MFNNCPYVNLRELPGVPGMVVHTNYNYRDLLRHCMTRKLSTLVGSTKQSVEDAERLFSKSLLKFMERKKLQL